MPSVQGPARRPDPPGILATVGDAARPNIYNQTADSEITILRSLLHAGSAPERSRL